MYRIQIPGMANTKFVPIAVSECHDVPDDTIDDHIKQAVKDAYRFDCLCFGNDGYVNVTEFWNL